MEECFMACISAFFSVQPYNKCVSCSVVLWPMNKGFTFTSQPEMEVSVCVFVYSNK